MKRRFITGDPVIAGKTWFAGEAMMSSRTKVGKTAHELWEESEGKSVHLTGKEPAYQYYRMNADALLRQADGVENEAWRQYNQGNVSAFNALMERANWVRDQGNRMMRMWELGEMKGW